MKACHIRVSGRVQGVGFRYFVREHALRLGLTGYVRNLPDGSVELLAAGAEEALQSLRSAVRRGPPGSRVSGYYETPAAPPDGQRHGSFLVTI